MYIPKFELAYPWSEKDKTGFLFFGVAVGIHSKRLMICVIILGFGFYIE